MSWSELPERKSSNWKCIQPNSPTADEEEDHDEHKHDEDKDHNDDEGGDDDDDEADVIIHGLGAEPRIYIGYYPLQWPPREQGVGRGKVAMTMTMTM